MGTSFRLAPLNRWQPPSSGTARPIPRTRASTLRMRATPSGEQGNRSRPTQHLEPLLLHRLEFAVGQPGVDHLIAGLRPPVPERQDLAAVLAPAVLEPQPLAPHQQERQHEAKRLLAG